MSHPTSRRPRVRVVAGLAVATFTMVSTSACAGGGGSEASISPDQAVQQATSHLDDTSGIQLSLHTDDDPGGTSNLTAAEGVVTTAPAFEGTASGTYQGIPVSDIGVVSVGGTFEVDIPIKGYSKLDPATLCAPDPATLLDPDTGVASVLHSATGLTAGGQTRGGVDNKETLTPYTGTVPVAAVKNILPCSAGDSYDVTFDITSDGYLRSAVITGDFSGGGTAITYTIDVEKYDVSQDISLPTSP